MTKKHIVRVMKLLGGACVILAISGYLYFIEIPKYQVENVVTTFENAVRDHDQKSFANIIDGSPYWYRKGKGPLFAMHAFEKLFGKFHRGMKVYSCIYQPNYLFGMGRDYIFAEGKMRAKIDGRYRTNFDIALVRKDGQWRLSHLYFPDYIDY